MNSAAAGKLAGSLLSGKLPMEEIVQISKPEMRVMANFMGDLGQVLCKYSKELNTVLANGAPATQSQSRANTPKGSAAATRPTTASAKKRPVAQKEKAAASKKQKTQVAAVVPVNPSPKSGASVASPATDTATSTGLSPAITGPVCSITKHGAVGDNSTLCTSARLRMD